MSHPREHLSTQQPFSFNTTRLATDFAERARQLDIFTRREVGAFELFKRVALKTLNGNEPERETFSPRRPGSGLTAIHFPIIDYDPTPTDSAERRQIVLRLDHIVEKGEVVSATPWLTVHPMEVSLDETLADETEHAFVRLPLEAIVGRREGDEAGRFFETMLSSHYLEARQGLIEEQAEYVTWLGRAATSVGMSPNFYEMPDNSVFAGFELS